jgi:ABC-2 type transport system ATP-binding protein
LACGNAHVRQYALRRHEHRPSSRGQRGLERLRRDGALDDLWLDVNAGELFGFVGRNGAGKTTTVRIVLGILSADAGEVRWAGAPLDLDARYRIGCMSGPEARASALRWLGRFGLKDRRDEELQKIDRRSAQT